MTTNPYQAPEVASGVRKKALKVPTWLLPTIVVAVVSAADIALFVIIPLLTPPRGSPGTLTVTVLMLISELVGLPGLPLFLAIQTTGLIPMGEDDDYVRGIWSICCNMVSWGVLAFIVSWLLARRQHSEPSNGN